MLTRFGILVVTYNQLEKTRTWINNYVGLDVERDSTKLLILDNASTDNTFPILRNEFPDLDLRLLNSNYGCTTGRNIGIAELYELGCDVYFGFDPDVIVENKHFFKNAIDFLNNHSEIDGFTPILRYYEDMSIQGLGGRRGHMGVMKTITQITSNHMVDYLPGGSSVIRMSAFEKYGIYDNDLPPIGGQDYEWGFRMTKLGGKLAYNPEMEVIHFHEKRAVNKDPIQRRWIFISRTVFLRKHFSLGHALREMKHFAFSIVQYDPISVIKSYYLGFTRRLRSDSTDLKLFLRIDRVSAFFSTFNTESSRDIL